MFLSQLLPNELVIDDSNAHIVAPDQDPIIEGDQKTRGRIPRDYSQDGFCSGFGSKALDLPLIPRSEWAARIQEKEAKKNRLSDHALRVGLKSKDQNGTNYCWFNGPITAAETLYAMTTNRKIILSPASGAAQLKNYRNVGGWGSQAVDFMAKHGVATVDIWPANAIDRKYKTAAEEQNATLHKAVEWYDLPGRDLDHVMTCLLLDIPVAVGFNWWGHEVCAMDGVVLGADTFGIRIRNSWTDDWPTHGAGGFAILSGSKMIPDDAVGLRVMSPTNR